MSVPTADGNGRLYRLALTLWLCLFATSSALAADRAAECVKTVVREPSPFLGNGGEIIVLADGSVWKVASYQYLYLYAYQPAAVVCPADRKLMLMDSVRPAVFDITPVR